MWRPYRRHSDERVGCIRARTSPFAVVPLPTQFRSVQEATRHTTHAGLIRTFVIRYPTQIRQKVEGTRIRVCERTYHRCPPRVLRTSRRSFQPSDKSSDFLSSQGFPQLLHISRLVDDAPIRNSRHAVCTYATCTNHTDALSSRPQPFETALNPRSRASRHERDGQRGRKSTEWNCEIKLSHLGAPSDHHGVKSVVGDVSEKRTVSNPCITNFTQHPLVRSNKGTNNLEARSRADTVRKRKRALNVNAHRKCIV